MCRILSEEDGKKYAGKYVCIISFLDHTVVAADLDPAVALEEARKKGFIDSVCFFVLKPFDKFAFLETAEAITL